ncbi:MAG: hypothetical protein JO020_22520 [Chloroflexi bacterium]|nr:hypothetical protein [Chloroflexota bacterium]MBV9896948.1 hypothetical protein [Chloroflexota bacterium]
MTYLRYDVWLDRIGLEALGLPELAATHLRFRDFAGTGNIEDLAHIGERAAEQIKPEHFPAPFDLLPQRSAG